MIFENNKYKHLLENSNLIDKEYHYDTEILDNLPTGYIDNFEQELKNHPDFKKIKDNYIIDKSQNVIIQIHERIPRKEIEDLSPEETFFYPTCNKQEIKRIFKVKNAKDFLLKFRAEQVIDNQRLLRVISSIRRNKGAKWNFSKFYSSKHFKKYLNLLPEKEYKLCKSIPFGLIHMNSANGYCMKTDYGNIIVISYALQHFLYYMNLFHFGESLGMKSEDTSTAFFIAVRILLGKESIDFELDPRGKVPKKIHLKVTEFTELQLLFVVGHEYAHHYLNHLKDSKLKNVNLLKSDNTKFYNYQQRQEFEADYNSIIKPDISNEKRAKLADSALMFFKWLDLFETIRDYMFPAKSNLNSHPNPMDRFWNIRDKKDIYSEHTDLEIKEFLDNYEQFKKMIIRDFLPFYTERLEVYGALYLPSYKEKVTHDRLI